MSDANLNTQSNYQPPQLGGLPQGDGNSPRPKTQKEKDAEDPTLNNSLTRSQTVHQITGAIGAKPGTDIRSAYDKGTENGAPSNSTGDNLTSNWRGVFPSTPKVNPYSPTAAMQSQGFAEQAGVRGPLSNPIGTVTAGQSFSQTDPNLHSGTSLQTEQGGGYSYNPSDNPGDRALIEAKYGTRDGQGNIQTGSAQSLPSATPSLINGQQVHQAQPQSNPAATHPRQLNPFALNIGQPYAGIGGEPAQGVSPLNVGSVASPLQLNAGVPRVSTSLFTPGAGSQGADNAAPAVQLNPFAIGTPKTPKAALAAQSFNQPEPAIDDAATQTIQDGRATRRFVNQAARGQIDPYLQTAKQGLNFASGFFQ